MKFCCEQFRGMVENAGNSGVAAIARIIGDQGGFFLQSRICNHADEFQFRDAAIAAGKSHPFPKPIRLTTLQGISYCPFCGNDLCELIGENQSDFTILTGLHKKFCVVN